MSGTCAQIPASWSTDKARRSAPPTPRASTSPGTRRAALLLPPRTSWTNLLAKCVFFLVCDDPCCGAGFCRRFRLHLRLRLDTLHTAATMLHSCRLLLTGWNGHAAPFPAQSSTHPRAIFYPPPLAAIAAFAAIPGSRLDGGQAGLRGRPDLHGHPVLREAARPTRPTDRIGPPGLHPRRGPGRRRGHRGAAEQVQPVSVVPHRRCGRVHTDVPRRGPQRELPAVPAAASVGEHRCHRRRRRHAVGREQARPRGGGRWGLWQHAGARRVPRGDRCDRPPAVHHRNHWPRASVVRVPRRASAVRPCGVDVHGRGGAGRFRDRGVECRCPPRRSTSPTPASLSAHSHSTSGRCRRRCKRR